MVDLSFIIPVYNGADTIVDTLDSIFSSGIAESRFEIIVTDDCSTDNTVAVLENYACSHENITILRQDRNHRQGAARNRGLAVARGRYLTFVDADDRVEPGMADALEEAIAHDVDICCPISDLFQDGVGQIDTLLKVNTDLPRSAIYSGRQFCESVANMCDINGTPWGYLFRTSFVRATGRIFIEDHFFEETDWIAYHFYTAKSLYLSDKHVYTYILRSGSVMGRDMSFDYVVDMSLLACRMMKLTECFADDGGAFRKVWMKNVDKGLLSKGIRWHFLVKFPVKEVTGFYDAIGIDNWQYLRKNYRGNLFRMLFFHSRLFTLLFFSIVRPLWLLYRKAVGRSAFSRNFYYR